MQELSMNVLDIAQNSVKANATIVQIILDFDIEQSKLKITIKDDGKGMSKEMLATVTDPFTTSRTTRKVGLGLPLIKMAAELTGGSLDIQSELNVGTEVNVIFTTGHIDLAPLGDMAGSISTLMQCNTHMDFIYTVKCDGEEFCASTIELKEVLGDVSLSEPSVALWVKDYIAENTEPIIKRSNAI